MNEEVEQNNKIQCFRKNSKLKSAGVSINFTQEQIKEYIKCAKDPAYFINNYVKVISLDNGIVPFKLYPYQQRIIKTVNSHRFSIGKLFRQAGKSTVMAAYVLWFTVFNPYKNSIILSNKFSSAKEIFSRVEQQFEDLPAWIKPGVTEWNKTAFSLDNNSSVSCTATSASAIRGKSCVSGETEILILENNICKKVKIKSLINLNCKNLKILTSQGFKRFDSVVSKGIKQTYKVTTEHHSLTCTKNHRLLTKNETYKKISKIKKGDILFLNEKIISIKKDIKQEVFDVVGVEKCHNYFSNGLVSHNCNLILLDEFAFLPLNLQDEFIASVFPVLSSSKESKLIIISTPNGIGNQFYKIWHDSELKKNDFARIQGHWSEIHDKTWFETQCKLLGNDKHKIAAELECIFEGSAITWIESKIMQELTFEQPIYDKNNLRYFYKPEQEHNYILSVDTARGHGKDFSAFIVLDVMSKPMKVVATYKDNEITPMQFATLINQVGQIYNNAFLLIESNDLGESVASALWNDFEYENILWFDSKGHVSGNGNIGVRTTRNVKAKGQNKMKTMIENNIISLSDERILKEMNVYSIGKNGLFSASDTKINDDLCACLFLIGWFSENIFFSDLTKTNIFNEVTKEFKENIIDNYVPFGFISRSNDIDDFQKITQEQKELLGY